MLLKRGIEVVPDLLANSGGVTCSYFEQVQSNSNYYWERDEVLAKLESRMVGASAAVLDLAERRGVSLREAAYLISVDRVVRACRDRGWIQ
jgi:glutamate dehydrogenase (NAD(P)+)